MGGKEKLRKRQRRLSVYLADKGGRSDGKTTMWGWQKAVRGGLKTRLQVCGEGVQRLTTRKGGHVTAGSDKWYTSTAKEG